MAVLPTAFWKRMIYQSFVNAKDSSDSALESDHRSTPHLIIVRQKSIVQRFWLEVADEDKDSLWTFRHWRQQMLMVHCMSTAFFHIVLRLLLNSEFG